MFDFETVTALISPLIVIACLTLGYVIKHGFNSKTLNAFIPLILSAVGIAANIWSTGIVDLQSVVTGAVSGLAATGLYEGFTNILNLPKLSETEPITIPYGTPIEDDEPRGKHAA